MTSYRYMRMDMNQNFIGDSDVSDDRVLDDFMVTPTDMTMDMHMVGVMYGLTDQLTMMAMIPYVEKEMNHRTRMGGEFKTQTRGVGDVSLTGMFSLKQSDEQKISLNMGLSFPTGSIDERGQTPAGYNKLPYPMQIGSGTYDLKPALTIVNHHGKFNWGNQLYATLRLGGKNDEGYRLGNRYGATTWFGYNWSEMISSSIRLDYETWHDIDGADSDLNPMLIPTARTDLRGGEKIDLLFGLNLLGQDNHLKGHRLAFEFGKRIYQKLDGPQLGTDWMAQIGWQKAF